MPMDEIKHRNQNLNASQGAFEIATPILELISTHAYVGQKAVNQTTSAYSDARLSMHACFTFVIFRKRISE